MSCKTPVADRCTGHCCREFVYDETPESLERLAETSERMRKIADMLTPVRPGRRGYLYNCKHHLANGDCAIYSDRPWMCREYPYGKPCNYPDCTHPDGGMPPYSHHVWYWLYETSVIENGRYWFTW